MNLKQRKSNYLVFEQLEIKLSGNIAKSICICYNADRQKDGSIHKMHKKDEPPKVALILSGVLLLLRRSQPLGLVTRYSSPSNHLHR